MATPNTEETNTPAAEATNTPTPQEVAAFSNIDWNDSTPEQQAEIEHLTNILFNQQFDLDRQDRA